MDEETEALEKQLKHVPLDQAIDLIEQVKSGNISKEDALSEAHHNEF